MTSLNYTPDKDIKVHEEGAIRLICRAFQSHENGLPEWLKNSSDAYARENAPEKRRIIIVILDYGRTNTIPSISCLDLSGMTSKMIEDNFRQWADPNAANPDFIIGAIQGGHGNGGKCYMTQMFEKHSIIHTVKNNKGNRYGVTGGSIKFGYIPDRDKGRDYLVEDVRSELQNSLSQFRVSTEKFPKAIQEVIRRTEGFTLISGFGPKGYLNKIPINALIENLHDHPQMIQTLELCKVYFVVNGNIYNNGQEIRLPEIPPMASYEQPRVINIPESLEDPLSGQTISTINNGSNGQLILKTSDKNMRYSRKNRHNLIFKAETGYIGYVPISDLDVQSGYRNNLYGECQLQSLEPFKQNDRGPLANSPLTRAVKRFISEQVEIYAREFEARDRRDYNREEKNAISQMNEALNNWKNRFLKDLMQGIWGPGKDSGTITIAQLLPTGKPVRLELDLSYQKAGVGVALRPKVKFFDKNGKRIRPVPFKWVSEDNNVAMIDEDLMVINTFSHGETAIYAQTNNGKLKSNKVSLEVVQIKKIILSPEILEIPLGSRQKINAICHLSSGEETSDVYLEWTENDPNVARVSSSGLVYAFSSGETKVISGDDRCMSINSTIIKVTPGQEGGKGNQRGRGYPLILISDYDSDPETSERIIFSREEPPITQRPQDVDRNIWWINSSSPLASLYLDKTKGYGYESREWRMYHLERYIDVIVQIGLTQGPTEKESLSANEWIMKWGEQVAEIQSGAANDLIDFINTGELPIVQANE